ncbi:hypothetical protein E4K67_15405 [Desulfosporosinus fructosivorans]|uniref:DUF2269 family protein n=1 Tax=Desulfosporosinus fructosivorans TaxID=2018669 RepID=A0A4Z0R4I9_9FIRM|nr:hypothetical protein [Desulfosporosinus fructosivorans]TGE37245.1 hypothetical protein E4K67_15405 [Desulfosporosinus fructosivorans]
MELGFKSKAWLKGFHVLFACAWLGAALSMILVLSMKAQPNSELQLYAVTSSLTVIDDFIIIPSAIGCLLTGLLYSVFTKWGFTKFYWIIFKWVTIILQIAMGTFFLGPWLNNMSKISNQIGFKPSENYQYISNFNLNLYFGMIQAALLIVVVFVSILKPWGKRVNK